MKRFLSSKFFSFSLLFLIAFLFLFSYKLLYAKSVLEQINEERVRIVQSVLPGVVTITAEKSVPNVRGGMPPIPFNLPIPKPRPQEALGSGFIVKIDWNKKFIYIITNNHVVENAKKIKVLFPNKLFISGKIIGRDRISDIAIVAVPFKYGIEKYASRHILKLGNSDSLNVGESVIAIGSPLGFKGTVTAGIVSALNRDFPDHPGVGFIQTDAAINPGNSGGPLINVKGEVIGINTAIIAGSEGIGFAVPINQAKWVMNEILKYGKVRRSRLGIIIQDLSPDLVRYFKISNGVIISQVLRGSPAEKAGLKPGDIILAVNNKVVKSSVDAVRYITQNPPGTKLTLIILRDKKTIKVPVITGGYDTASASESTSDIKNLESKYGLVVIPLTPEIQRQYGLEGLSYGVVVYAIKRGSVAERTGLRVGDIILQVDKTPVKTPKQFWSIISKAEKSGKTAVLIYMQRGNTRLFRTLPILR